MNKLQKVSVNSDDEDLFEPDFPEPCDSLADVPAGLGAARVPTHEPLWTMADTAEGDDNILLAMQLQRDQSVIRTYSLPNRSPHPSSCQTLRPLWEAQTCEPSLRKSQPLTLKLLSLFLWLLSLRRLQAQALSQTQALWRAWFTAQGQGNVQDLVCHQVQT